MPFSITNLRNWPSPLSRLEFIQRFDLSSLFSEQEHQTTVVYKQSIVVSVHTCNKIDTYLFQKVVVLCQNFWTKDGINCIFIQHLLSSKVQQWKTNPALLLVPKCVIKLGVKGWKNPRFAYCDTEQISYLKNSRVTLVMLQCRQRATWFSH